MSGLRSIELNHNAKIQMLTHLLSDIGKPASVYASAGLERRLLIGLGANNTDGTELRGWWDGPPNVKTYRFGSRNLFPNFSVLDLEIYVRRHRRKKRRK